MILDFLPSPGSIIKVTGLATDTGSFKIYRRSQDREMKRSSRLGWRSPCSLLMVAAVPAERRACSQDCVVGERERPCDVPQHSLPWWLATKHREQAPRPSGRSGPCFQTHPAGTLSLPGLCTGAVLPHALEAPALTWGCWDGVAVLPPGDVRLWRSADFALQNDLAADVNLQVGQILDNVRRCLCCRHKGEQHTATFQKASPTALPSTPLWPATWPCWKWQRLADEW